MCDGCPVRTPSRFRHALVVGMLALAGACSSETPDPVDPTVSPTPIDTLAALTDEELVGQVLMPDLNITDPVDAAVALVEGIEPGGVILMGSGSAEQVKALTDALQAAAPAGRGKLLITTDQEYGFVTRIRSGMLQLPAAMAMGAADRPDLTQAAWSAVGEELAAIGINVDNAPVADVIGPAGNRVIGSRSFGSNPGAVAPQVVAAVRGLQGSGVAATLKHFPGHGNTTVDSHTDLPVLSQSREQLEADLAPFRAGIEAGAKIIMTGHLDVQAIDPGTPATFSQRVLIDLLRTELGFTGVVVSDALNMASARQWPDGEAAVRAILAGNDLLLMPPSVVDAKAGLLEALRSGRLPRERLIESVTRILDLKASLAATPRSDMSTLDSAEHVAAAQAVAAAAVTVLHGPCTGPLVAGPVQVTAASGRDQAAAWLRESLTAAGVEVVDSGGSVVHLVGYGDDAADLSATAAVTVAMDTPYLLASAASPVKVATYSSTQVSMRALAQVIAGAATAPGRSPVPVSGLPASACAS